jgi:hypothetical protein
MSDWWERSQRVYQERGYLVIARISPYRIGQVVAIVSLLDKMGQELPQPFRIIAETDAADYRTQSQMAGYKLDWPPPGEQKFYRMVTD